MKKIVSVIILSILTMFAIAQTDYPKPYYKNSPFYYDGSEITELDATSFSIGARPKGLYGAESSLYLEGVTSFLKIKPENAKFLVKLDADIDPKTLMDLNKTVVNNRSEKREYVMYKVGAFTSESTNNTINLIFKRVEEGIYLVTAREPLGDGEYFFSVAESQKTQIVYCFTIKSTEEAIQPKETTKTNEASQNKDLENKSNEQKAEEAGEKFKTGVKNAAKSVDVFFKTVFKKKDSDSDQSSESINKKEETEVVNSNLECNYCNGTGTKTLKCDNTCINGKIKTTCNICSGNYKTGNNLCYKCEGIGCEYCDYDGAACDNCKSGKKDVLHEECGGLGELKVKCSHCKGKGIKQ